MTTAKSLLKPLLTIAIIALGMGISRVDAGVIGFDLASAIETGPSSLASVDFSSEEFPEGDDGTLVQSPGGNAFAFGSLVESQRGGTAFAICRLTSWLGVDRVGLRIVAIPEESPPDSLAEELLKVPIC